MNQLDALIDKRAEHGDVEREREAMYAESVRRYHGRRRIRNQAAWYAFHTHMQNLNLGLDRHAIALHEKSCLTDTWRERVLAGMEGRTGA